MRPGYTFRSGRPTVTAITKSARPFVLVPPRTASEVKIEIIEAARGRTRSLSATVQVCQPWLSKTNGPSRQERLRPCGLGVCRDGPVPGHLNSRTKLGTVVLRYSVRPDPLPVPITFGEMRASGVRDVLVSLHAGSQMQSLTTMSAERDRPEFRGTAPCRCEAAI